MGKQTLLVAGNLAGNLEKTHAKTLPIDYIIKWLKDRMPEFGAMSYKSLEERVLIVRSETGSGKSTVLPAFVLRLLRSEKTPQAIKLLGPGVICTQPRILTAQTLARDQSENENYPDLVIGVTVGYQTGPVSEKPSSGLIYATAGTLLAQLKNSPDSDIINRYRFILVDEAHERSHDIDLLLMNLKAFLKRNIGNPRTPFVLLTSATLPTEKYANYFELTNKNVVEVTGRAYGVERVFPKVGTNDYIKEAANVAIDIHQNNPDDDPARADILVFMPGAREIENVVEILTKENWKFRTPDSKIPPFLLLVVTRNEVISQSKDFQLLKVPHEQLPLLPATDGKTLLKPFRRITIATVVAETGLTIETLKYVIDCGWSRSQETYFPGEYKGLITRPAPQSRIKQRLGRAGRKFPGVFHPLYTKNTFDILPVEQSPEIVTEGVAPIFINIVSSMSQFKVENIDMLDPPPIDALADALEKAIMFGYLRNDIVDSKVVGHKLTEIGKSVNKFHYLQMHHIQTLLSGYLWHVSISDLALIVALFDLREVPLYQKHKQKDKAEEAKRKALKTGLPNFLLNTTGGDEEVVITKPTDISPTASEEYYYRAKILIADDFIEGLIAFEGFVNALSVISNAKEGDLRPLLKWCDENGFDFQGALQLAEMRETVINELITAGYNPFYGDEYKITKTTPELFFDTIVRLKHCIYAGLRFYSLEYKNNTYKSRFNDTIEVPAFWTESEKSRIRGMNANDLAEVKPKKMVTNVIRLRGAQKDRSEKNPPALYRLVPGLLSVLDGYVYTDNTIEDPRLSHHDG